MRTFGNDVLEAAARGFQRALAMDQELGIAHGFSGDHAAFLGRAGETMPAVQKAMSVDRSDRRHSIWFFFGGFAELLRLAEPKRRSSCSTNRSNAIPATEVPSYS